MGTFAAYKNTTRFVSQRLKNMRYVAAALLVALGGNDVSEANIKKLLDVVGIEADSEKMAMVVKELKGKSLEELTPKVKRSWLPYPPEVLEVPPPLLLLALLEVLPKKRKRRRRKNLKKNPMTTWDSDFLIKFHKLRLYFSFKLKTKSIAPPYVKQ